MSQLKIVVKDSQHLKKLIKEDVNHELDLGSLDVSNVTDMSHLFENSTRVDFSGIETWDMTKVKNINSMFFNAVNFNHDVTDWTLSSLSLQDKSSFFLIENVFFNTEASREIKSIISNKKNKIVNLDTINNKLPLSKQYIATQNCVWDDFKTIIDIASKEDDNPLKTFDVSYIKDFSHFLEDANLNSYSGLEEWVTTNASDFSYFACNAKNFNNPLTHFNFKNCKRLSFFLANTDFNQPLNFNGCSKFHSVLNMLYNCKNFEPKNLLAFDNNNTNLNTVPLAASVLNNAITNRNILNTTEYNDEYEQYISALDDNYNFISPLDSKNVIILRDEKYKNFLTEFYSDNNYLYELSKLPAKKFNDFSCYLSNDSEIKKFISYFKDNKIDPETVFTTLSLRDYVTLDCYLKDKYKAINWDVLLYISEGNSDRKNPVYYKNNHTDDLLFNRVENQFTQLSESKNPNDQEFLKDLIELQNDNIIKILDDTNDQKIKFKINSEHNRLIPPKFKRS